MMNIDNGIPSANHTVSRKMLEVSGACSWQIIGTFVIWVVRAIHITRMIDFYWLSETLSLKTCHAAILSFFRSVRFYMERVSAMFALNQYTLAGSQFWYFLYRPGLRLVSTGARAIIVIQDTFGGLTVKGFSALRAS